MLVTMNSYRYYLSSTTVTERKLRCAFDELQVDPTLRIKITDLMHLLKNTSLHTYQHCIRVGLLCKNIGNYLGLDTKALFYSGLFHDLGKYTISKDLLNKTVKWTKTDMSTMEPHVLKAYELLKGNFDFTAEIVLWHHKFQDNPYPDLVTESYLKYTQSTRELIKYYGRIVSIADVYDALHRYNTKQNSSRYLTGDEIKMQLITSNQDKQSLIEDLYKTKIFIK